ncbi:MAG: hypothetical protein ACO21O_05440, partial [Steroidobacteraceae bacterium]
MSDTPWFKSSLWLPTLVALGLILLALSSALLAVGGRLQQQDRQYLQTVGSLQRVAAAHPAAATPGAGGGTQAVHAGRIGVVNGRISLRDDRDHLAVVDDVVEQIEGLPPA